MRREKPRLVSSIGSLVSRGAIFVFAQKSGNFSRFLPATGHLQLAPTCKTPRNPKDPKKIAKAIDKPYRQLI